MKKCLLTLLYFLVFTLSLHVYSESIEKLSQERSLHISSSSIDEELEKYVQFSQTGPNYIGYLYIPRDRGIDQSTYLYVKLALEAYKKSGVCCILLHLDTPGGEIFSSMEITSLLQKADREDHIPVIAFIDNWAVSAGAMLAYSCRFIGATNTSIMGAAEPVYMKDGEMEPASEKVNSALRAEFANLARFYGRDPLIAEAMVDKDITLVLRKGSIIKLEPDEKVKGSDVLLTKQGKLLTLDANELQNLGVADFFVQEMPLTAITKEEFAQGKWPAAKSLAFQQPFLSQIPNAFIVSHQDWKAGFFGFLSHPAVASLLAFGLIIGIYMEMSSPGFGVPAGIALTCLALILLSSFAIKAVNWIELIIFVTGVGLLFLEIFILPTFGIGGVLGIILTVVGLFLLLLPQMENLSFTLTSPSSSFAMEEIFRRLAWFCGAIILSAIAISLLGRFVSRRSFFYKRLISAEEQESALGYVAGRGKQDLPEKSSVGRTISSLRPSGKIVIDEKVYDAFSEGGFIEADLPIYVVRIEGNKIIVRVSEEKKI